VLFYGLLAFAVFNALVYEAHSTVRVGVIFGLALVLAAWHGLWRLPGTGPADAAYFVGAAVVWAGLMVADPDFLVLALGIFAPLCFHDVRWGAVALVGTGGVWLWLERLERGSIPWGSVLAVAVFVATGLLLVGYFSTVVRQSGERQRLIDELRATQDELAEAERQAGVLMERERLARDIHDTLTQGFASIVMLLEAAAVGLDTGASSRRHVVRALETARENLVESRRLISAMRPATLTDASLAEAIRRLAQQLAEDTGIEVESTVTGSPSSISADEEDEMLRVAQEVLNNIRKHAGATRVNVTLSYMGNAVVLDVQDNGVGMIPESAKEGAGLRSMRERAEALSGKLTIESSPGEGTTVALEIPTAASRPTPVVADRQQ
jgi:signal transduction histidine kinase